MMKLESLQQSGDWIEAVKLFIYGVFAFLDLDTDVVQILFWLMIADTGLGITKTLVLGNSFSFKKLMWGMVTKISVLLLPMILALVAKGLSFDFTWFVVSVLNILVVSEGFSAVTNILSIKEKRNIKSVDFVTVLLKKVRDGMSNIIQKLLGNIESGEEPADDNQ